VYEPTSNVSIKYDAASGTYTYDSFGRIGTFPEANRTTSGYFDTYQSSEPANTTLTLYNNVRAGASQSGAPINLTYLSFGYYRYDDPRDDGLLGLHFEDYIMFGYRTEASDMPKTGSATYSTAVFADTMSMDNNDPITSITGTATFTANFGAGTVDTALTLPFAHEGSTFSTYDGNGAITGNLFTGKFTTSDDPDFHYGNFAGGFFGPAADEMGYTFSLNRGGNVGPNTYTIGAVVGTKSNN